MAKTELERICPTCLQPFRQPAGPGSGKGSGLRVYCSMACKPAGSRVVPPDGIETKKTCDVCLGEFINIRVGRGRDRKYCSTECAKAAQLRRQRERISGIGHPLCDIPGCPTGSQNVKGGLCYSHYQFQHRAKKFGLTSDQLLSLMMEQEDRCAICKVRGKTLSVDHCHSTGQVRGLLCATCNTGIGMLQDDEAIMLSAIEYLRTSKRNLLDGMASLGEDGSPGVC